jgi:ABC-2 type transport system permease protein
VILRREYAQRIYWPSFIASTFLLPGVTLAIPLVAVWLVGRGGGTPIHASAAPAVSHIPGAVTGAALSVLFLLFVMFVPLFTYGVILMRAVLDEKQSRVLEVLLCFASPSELMVGKILGVGGVAWTQVLVWLGLALGAIALNPALREVIEAMHLGPAALIYFILFDILGYLLYSVLFAAIGAAFNSQDEAQQWVFVMVVPLAVTAMLVPILPTRPDAPVLVMASIIPFTAPVLMYARILIGHPPVWQIGLAFGLLAATIAIVIRICAAIYSMGILMYGKKPTAREIIRWLRYA